MDEVVWVSGGLGRGGKGEGDGRGHCAQCHVLSTCSNLSTTYFMSGHGPLAVPWFCGDVDRGVACKTCVLEMGRCINC